MEQIEELAQLHQRVAAIEAEADLWHQKYLDLVTEVENTTQVNQYQIKFTSVSLLGCIPRKE